MLLLLSASLRGQAGPAVGTAPDTQPVPIPVPASSAEPRTAPRQRVEFQTISVHARYRFLDSNRAGSSHDPQYKEAIRARFNFDSSRRYALSAGFFSGTQFIGTFDNLGLGLNQGDYHNHHLKQLFFSAAPVPGIELQYGGLYIERGQNTEITTYDDDGYMVGQRLTVRRPKQLFFDEVGAAAGTLGPSREPNLLRRLDGLGRINYAQVLLTKQISPALVGSADYTSTSGTGTVHAALAWRLPPAAAVTRIRVEHYYRMRPFPAQGFAVTADAPVKTVRLSGGYATVDEMYDGNAGRAKLNSERMQRGRRVFASLNVPLPNALSAVFAYTQALPAAYELTNRTRFDAMIQYDILAGLRQAAHRVGPQLRR